MEDDFHFAVDHRQQVRDLHRILQRLDESSIHMEEPPARQ
jgi:hypothetical protein